MHRKSVVINRRENIPAWDVEAYQRERVLITGHYGSIGGKIYQMLQNVGVDVVGTDIDSMDVTDAQVVDTVIRAVEPTIVLHLAGAKHAPAGEENPIDPCDVHIRGTQNVLDAAASVGARVVTSSTCKSCNPETAYGASKLVAERLTLNAGQVVARFHNVVETSGNVFEIWRRSYDAIQVSENCERYFITLAEACGLVLFCGLADHGRYIVDPGQPQQMTSIANRLYPDVERVLCAPRRGDRLVEPLMASDEEFAGSFSDGSVFKVVSKHDVRVVA